MKRATVIFAALLVVVILLFVTARWWETTPSETNQVTAAASIPTQATRPPSTAQEPTPLGPPATVEEGKSEAEKVTRMITAFHTRMGENPVGTNAEITKSLMGGNPVHATFAPEPPSLNAKGELLDPWGTPYFFHQLSGNEMEIHSAGPDKIMGTADDIIQN